MEALALRAGVGPRRESRARPGGVGRGRRASCRRRLCSQPPAPRARGAATASGGSRAGCAASGTQRRPQRSGGATAERAGARRAVGRASAGPARDAAIGRGLRRWQQQARGGCGPPSAGDTGGLAVSTEGGTRRVQLVRKEGRNVSTHRRGAGRVRREQRAFLAAATPPRRAGPGGCAGAGCRGAAQQRRPRRSEGARARRGRAERRPARNRSHGGAAALLRLPLRAAVRTAPARLRLYLRVRVRVCPTPSWGRRVACGRSLRARCCRTSVASVYCRSQEQQGCISAARI